MSDPLLQSVTRQQLAQFIKDPRTLRAFEQAVKNSNELLPAEVVQIYQRIDEALIEGQDAATRSTQAVAAINRLAAALELLAVSPPQSLAPLANQVSIANAQPMVKELADVRLSAPAAGSVLIYDATLRRWVGTTLTPGTNVTITNADGTITLAVNGAPPTGAAGGVLSGTYPNPGFAVDMATQAELDAHTGATAVHGATGAVVGTTNSQTLTNKTLSAPVVTGTTDLQGGQIKFPATQVPSTDANTLDDYEEGDWTPTVTASSGTITSYTLVGANYTKVGRTVHVNFAVTITNAGTGAGSLDVTLPFTNGAVIANGTGRENALTGVQLQARVNASSATMNIQTYANATAIATNAQIRASMTYFV